MVASTLIVRSRLAPRRGLACAPLWRAFSSHVDGSGDAASNITTMKFGGTSIGTPEKMEKISRIIADTHSGESRAVAVVSALSSETKEDGTTSRLLAAAEGAVSQKDYLKHLEKIEDLHIEVVYSLLKDRKNRDETKSFIQSQIDRVRSFCESLSVIREISPRSHDLIIGTGERLSAGLVAAVLRDAGLNSKMLDLSNAFPDGLDTSRRGYHHTAKRTFAALLAPLLKNEVLPVVTGFVGSVNGGIIKGVGRGYTDLTAALVAGAVNAKALEVWKDSGAIFTANPMKIEDARLLDVVTPEEASELTYFGNEVLHPFTMECAIENNILINILDTARPDKSGGTSIVEASIAELNERRGPRCQGIAAVCSKKGIPVLNLMSNRFLDSSSFLALVFEQFAKRKVKADIISTSVSNLTVTLHESTPKEAIDALINDLEEYGKAELNMNRAIVSCIGAPMKHQRGLASKVFHCLSNAGISLEMISQGASEVNISVVIPEQQMQDAISTIHDEFLA